MEASILWLVAMVEAVVLVVRPLQPWAAAVGENCPRDARLRPGRWRWARTTSTAASLAEAPAAGDHYKIVEFSCASVGCWMFASVIRGARQRK